MDLREQIRKELRVMFSRRTQPVPVRVAKWAAFLSGDGGDDMITGAEGAVGDNNGTSGTGAGGNDTIVATPRPNGVLIGDNSYGGSSGGDDRIFGLGGNDAMSGLGGNDTLLGGGGEDTLLGGNGRDRLLGGTGGDELRGQYNNDALYASDGVGGNDVARGGPQTDTCEADAGDELVGCED